MRSFFEGRTSATAPVGPTGDPSATVGPQAEPPPSSPAYFNELNDLEKKVFRRTVDLIDRADRSQCEPTEPERQSMRSFLQRAETRLSTYQRVAGVFLNGAGLLVLLPGLVRENSLGVLKMALDGATPYGHYLVVVWSVAVVLPLYAFYFLVKDLVQFYFTPTFFAAADMIPTTRFSLGGLSFPADESPEVKARTIAHHVHHPKNVTFGLGGASAESLIATYKESHGGRLSSNLRNALMQHFSRKTAGITELEQISLAYSIAGSLDLSLTDEVTRVEMSLARHGLQLRRLVLRYAKALILFITTTIYLVVAAITTSSATAVACCRVDATASGANVPTVGDVFVVVLLSLAWSLSSMWAVRLPVRWIDKLGKAHQWIAPQTLRDGEERPMPSSFTDPDLKKFEKMVLYTLGLTSAYTLVLMGSIAYRQWGELWSALLRSVGCA